jgi:hypothetical protein
MKYLKSFNESIEQIKQDCKDILLELEDNGFECEIYFRRLLSGIEIGISRPSGFHSDEIMDVILRFDEYLGYHGYHRRSQIGRGRYNRGRRIYIDYVNE